jgi:hypothetical protein
MNNIPNVTIWGKAENTTEIAPNIYRVDTAGHGGIVMRKHIAERELSEEARRCGLERGDWIYFEEDCQAFVVYRELLDRNAKWNLRDITATRTGFEQHVNENIKSFNPEYWGYRLWRLADKSA